MAMQPVVKPQETKPAPLPAYPVAPPSQTQTSSRGMVPPKHLAGGAAYAGVPKGIPHYADGSADVLPQAPSGSTSFSGPSHPVAQFTPPPAPVPVARGPNGRVLYAPPPGVPTASELMAAHRGAFAQAVFGGITPQAPAVTAGATPGGPMAAPAPAPAGPMPTVARGLNTGGLEAGGDGVSLVGQPYASTPQQVATAAANTGVNAATLQNEAGAARDAIGQGQPAIGGPGQPQNMDVVQHAVANAPQYSSGNFVNALRGVSFRHLAMVAQALRTAMPYNPQEQAWQQLHAQNNQNLVGMPDPNSPEAKALRLRDERELMKRAGVDYIQPSFAQPPQTDPVTGEQLY